LQKDYLRGQTEEEEEKNGSNSQLATRLKKSIGIEGRGEQNTILEFALRADAKLYKLYKKEALIIMEIREEGPIYWPDRARLENEHVGSAVVWKEGQEWKEEKSYLGKKKEVFDAEVYAILRALWKAVDIRECESEETERVTIFSDSTTAIQTVQHMHPRPEQAMAIDSVNLNNQLAGHRIQVEYRWVLSHKGVEGNERADEAAKAAAKNEDGEALRRREKFRGSSMARVQRNIRKAKRTVTEASWKAKFDNSKKTG
jgi:ribonuclease HI